MPSKMTTVRLTEFDVKERSLLTNIVKDNDVQYFIWWLKCCADVLVLQVSSQRFEYVCEVLML